MSVLSMVVMLCFYDGYSASSHAVLSMVVMLCFYDGYSASSPLLFCF